MPVLNLDGSRLHYREEGRGTPVIALHSSGSSGAQWRSLTGCLSGRYRVLTPDLPGYGRSDAPGSPAAGLAGEADSIAALIAHAGGRAHVVGHSFGGAVALKLALTRPDAVASLTLIEPAAFRFLHEGSAGDRMLHVEIARLARRLDCLARLGADAAAMRRFVDFWNGAGAFARSSPELQAYFLACLERVRANFAAIAAEPMRLRDCVRLRRPALVIAGETSPALARRVSDLVAAALPHAQLRRIAGAGHMLPLTDPHLVDPMIAAHIANTEAPAADCRPIAA